MDQKAKRGKRLGDILLDTFLFWWRNRAGPLSAGLTYYALASLVPLFIILVGIAGALFSPERIEAVLVAPLQETVGPETGSLLRQVIEQAYEQRPRGVATAASTLVLYFMASGFMKQLHQSLNLYWGRVFTQGQESKAGKKKPIWRRLLGALWGEVRVRTRAFLIVSAAGLLVVSSVLISVGLNVLAPYLGRLGEISFGGLALLNWGVTYLEITILFALTFRYVPQATFPWRAIWPGALLGAGVYALLQFLLSEYFRLTSVFFFYGAAGSLVVLLFWLYYSIQAIFFGAALVIVLSE
jgi:membrane protein